MSLTVANSVDRNEWHLPTYDPKNENKYHYKLQSLDIYFWTQKDALQFINGVRRVLPPAQVEVLEEPGSPQPAGLSSVVQKLENVAISDPQYSTAAPLASKATSRDPTAPAFASSSSGLLENLPPPPPPPASFVPMAYNPAAPAAPEAIRHREKTPPPDEDPLNPLAVAVAHDYQKQPFTPGFPPQSQFPLGVTSPGLPPNTVSGSGLPTHFAGPPTQPGIQRAVTMPANVALASPGFPGSPGLVPPPPPPPTTQATGNGNFAVSSPPGGVSNYTYGHQVAARQDSHDYSIHQQLYRPTEVESGTNKPHQYQPKADTRGRLEENAGRLERGVSGMLKKFEKKFG